MTLRKQSGVASGSLEDVTADIAGPQKIEPAPAPRNRGHHDGSGQHPRIIRKHFSVVRKNFSAVVSAALMAAVWLSAAAAIPTPAAQQAATAEVHMPLDVSRSKVHYTVSTSLHTVHGEFAVKSGAIHFDPETGAATGEIVVDATSGQSGSDGRDNRMHKEILQSDRFSEAVFRPDRVIGKVALAGSSAVQVHGIFTLHGAGHDLTIPVHVDFSGDHWNSTATFAVPYIEWGLKNPSNFLFKVSPTVNVNLELTGSLQLPEPH